MTAPPPVIFLLLVGVLCCACLVLLAVVAVLRRKLARLRSQADEVSRAGEILSGAIGKLRAAEDARLRAEAASEAKSRMLATVSHEIRTPLHGIIGMADLLAGSSLSREQQSYVTMIRTSGSALTTLVNEILDLSRIESGRLQLESEPFDLQALVEGVVELIAPRAQEKGLEIAASVGRDVPVRVVGDALRLRQVLTNLIDNAVKFTEFGGVGVRVAAGPDGALQFSVVDTGPGVPVDRRSAIFEAFEQAEGSTVRQHGGSGLGLAIAKRIIAGMGGDLVLRDPSSGGSEFAFAVVLPTAPELGEPGGTRGDFAGRRALIVSPGLFQPAFLAEQLAADRVLVERAGTLAEGVEALRRGGEALDLLFVDCALGPSVRELADAATAAGVRQTVLLFTAAERRRFGQQLTDVFDSWLVKPVRSHSLAARLIGAGDRHRPGPAQALGRPIRSARLAGLRILVADDNPINALIARTTLEHCGAEVTLATDGLMALDRFEDRLARDRSSFDLVLMDLSMPGLDGLEATRRIRQAERSAGVAPTRIVATTAHAFEATVGECRQAGMNDVLTKPIDPSAFRAIAEAGWPVRNTG